jgi:prepilin-type N-terminal cleavage/methylation domain-containing protein
VTCSTRSGSDDGFTLLETLIALMVFAVATTVFARSVSMATGQIARAERLTAAGILGARVVAETDMSALGASLQGTDIISGLKWRRVAEPVGDGSMPGVRDNTVLIAIEIFDAAGTEPLLQLRTAVAGPQQQ